MRVRVILRLAQVFQEPGLVLLGKNVFGHLFVHARCPQLLEQLRRRHFQLTGELGNARLGHRLVLLLRKPVLASLHDQGLGALGVDRRHLDEVIGGQIGQVVSSLHPGPGKLCR